MENIKILIVEDDYTSATYLKELLTDIGYIVADVFSTGKEAINYLKKFDVDIILMDIELEGSIDGIETVKIIHQFKNPYIIYITSLKDKITFTRAKATFPKYFLSKPFNKFQLLDIIEKIIFDKNNKSKKISSFYKDYFFAKNNGILKKYKTDSVHYIKADGSYAEIFFKEDEFSSIILSKNLKVILHQLESEKICRIHRSYAINLSEIINIDNWHIKLNKSETSFFVQESYRSSFEKFIKKI
jgi:DNA-binding LytR/AlgR family response regulator